MRKKKKEVTYVNDLRVVAPDSIANRGNTRGNCRTDFMKEGIMRFKNYDGHTIVNEGSVCSQDFKEFSEAFKSYLKDNGINVVKHNCNHYDFSGFAKENDAYVYYSWTWDRYHPIKVNSDSIIDSIMVRFAKSDHDYNGGNNRFCSLAEAPLRIKQMFSLQRS